MKEYHKLVRDKIPDIIREKGSVASTHIASDDEYRTKLYQKLAEEVVELTEEPSLEEAADLWEVFLAICKLEGWFPANLEKVRLAKARERGAFEKRVILDSVQ